VNETQVLCKVKPLHRSQRGQPRKCLATDHRIQTGCDSTSLLSNE